MTLEEYLKSKYSKTAVKGYLNVIYRFKLALGERAAQATHADILDYIGLLRNQNLHPKSLRNNLFAIKIYFYYLIEINIRTDHPCKYLQLKDRIDRQIHIESLYTKETLEELYENYQARNPFNQNRDKIIISLLIYQALTVLEISQLTTNDIDLTEGTIKIKDNKKNKGRTLSLKPKQILLFNDYLNQDLPKYLIKQKPNNQQDFFLLSEEGIQLWKSGINRLINHDRSKETKLTPLRIRQSVIANLLKQNNDIRVIQAFAGHRRTASTEAYKQTGLEELKSAISKHHPLQ